jgi:hypothetical protein
MSKLVSGVTDNQLKQLARSGQLKVDHELSLEGKEQWFKAATVKGLFPITPKPHSVPPVISAEIVEPKNTPEDPVVVHLARPGGGQSQNDLAESKLMLWHNSFRRSRLISCRIV